MNKLCFKVYSRITYIFFLDSSCSESKEHYPNNTQTEFIIDLPERWDFQRKWYVTLKSLFIPNRIHNVHSCYYQYEIYDKKTYKRTFVKFHKISDGHYSTVSEIIEEMQKHMKKENIPVINYEKNGNINIKHETLENDSELS